MEKNTMKWLSRMRLPKSFHAPIRRAEAEKESTPCLLFAQQPNPAGRQREEKRGKRVGRVGWERRLVWGYRWGRRRSHCRFHSLFFRQLGFSKRRSSARPSRHTHTQTCTARADTHTHLQKHTNPLEPPETSDQGVSPPNTSSPHHLYRSATAFCQSQQQNGRSRKKMGRKKKQRVSISLQSSTWATFID